ncbi:MAG: DNA translocase FtsK 4TM domain-containing protein [Deltaproteobacteria bacterium]|nr:DNA translocase FtsK 4TM domain-containing protein [Deltaproteobacteria bacterium]
MASKEKNSVNSHVEEISGLIIIALSLFYFMALVTYSPSDPSFNSYVSDSRGTDNLGGVVGAFISDISLQLFGLSSYILPAITLLAGIFLLVRKQIKIKEASKIAGLILLLLASSAFLSLLKTGSPIKGGGVTGDALSTILVAYLNYWGAYLFSALALVLSLILTTGISTVTFVKTLSSAISRILMTIYHSARNLLRKYLERRRRLKGTKSRIKKEEAKKKSSPTIIVEPMKSETSAKAKKESQESLPFMDLQPKDGLPLPSFSLLDAVEKKSRGIDKESIIMNSRILEKKLGDFGVDGEVHEVHPGPVITMYEFVPAPGVKVNKVVNLTDDLAMALSAISIRIVAPIPGKAVIGIEIPNKERETVFFKEILTSEGFERSHSMLSLALGKDIGGQPVVTDLARMPHLLVAGATGAGKSVSVNSMICSILYKATPNDVRFIMVDPKMLELSVYDGIPHLLLPVVTDPKKAALALRWTVSEMERRYQLLAETGVKNIISFNRLVEKNPVFTRKNEEGEEEEVTLEKLPYIVVVIDELADLMMVASKDVEECIMRLAQMARASGIHLILATQRPSVDVITGIIKANFPSRIAFQVSSKIDSRTILDSNGAENLLGSGDMLFLTPGASKIHRVHGAYISEAETHRIVNFLKKVGGKPAYDETILKPKAEENDDGYDDEYDEKYDEAVKIVCDIGTASISMIQRRMRIGYNRAARLIEKMEQEGIVGPSDGTSKGREVLISRV